jgi:hypothetical protein
VSLIMTEEEIPFDRVVPFFDAASLNCPINRFLEKVKIPKSI